MPYRRKSGPIVDKRYGRLLVLKELPTSATDNYTRWIVVRCDCGVEKTINANNVLSGTTTSCGCWQSERMAGMAKALGLGGKKTHGMTNTHVWRIWRSMINRCERPADISYPNYGGRGIVVCDRWRESFEAFLADMGEPTTTKHSIDRYPNKDGNYEPGNCRWATAEEQQNNTRKNRLITIDGTTKTLAQWCRVTGVPYGAASRRIHVMGWEEARAVTQPVRQ
jgi:hypothetical protein